MDSSIKKSLISGSFWSLFGKFSYVIVGALCNIFLARLLGPKVFGQIGIIMFFIIISKVLSESGLSGALVRKNDVTEKDYSTVFIFNLFISLLLMLILILASPYVAAFYNDPQLVQLLKIASLILPIDAFRIVQNAKLVHSMSFKKKSIYELVTVVLASTIGVGLALMGYGVWAIVAMQLSTAFILTLLLWFFEGPLKKISFNKDSFMGLYKFGINTTLTSLLNTGFDNIYQLILGKYFSLNQTGLFYQAKKIQEIPVSIISSLMHGVFYSALSKIQNDKRAFSANYKRIVMFFSSFYGIVLIIVILFAEEIILFIYGKEWLSASFYLRILIVTSFFYLQEVLNQVIFKVYDKTKKIFHLEILKKIIQIITIFIGVYFVDIHLLLFGFLLTNIISSILNTIYALRETTLNIKSNLLKIFSIVTIVLIISFGTMYTSELLITKFLVLPFLIVFYLWFLKSTRVYNIINDLKLVTSNINKNKI